MAQRYTDPVARERMSHSQCPECGLPAATHIDDIRFWIPRQCDLLPRGVEERIAQYHADYDPIDAEQGPLEQGWAANRREDLANPALVKEWD